MLKILNQRSTTHRRRWYPLQLAAIVAMLCAISSGEDWKTTVPYTYNIDYSQGHVNNPEYIRKIAEAPPTLMHVGEDIVFSSVFGTKGVFGGPQRTHAQVITAEEARQKIKELQQYTA